ncbi:Lipopolysaccharide biosynthesis protein [Lachnospiraceae bacterium C10]|nr:Lipopolysaccharide biosynthesis protein [Lachnospiraceae bacterium C10]
MKVISFYLPQYHECEDNNRWWGKGYTEWRNVKNARRLFAGHRQPRVPLNDNYYDLLNPSTMLWQAELAKRYGIYGFAYYHYWFNGKKLLEKPLENMLNNKNIDMPYCLAWANEEWKKYWYGAGEEVLIAQDYGFLPEWRKHFEYLVPFFRDERYIKIEGKPLFIIYRPGVIRQGKYMACIWNEMAQKCGFPGIYFMGMKNWEFETNSCGWLDAKVDYEPTKEQRNRITKKYVVNKGKYKDIFNFGLYNRLFCNVQSYARINEIMLKEKHEPNEFHGVFVDFDNSPRAQKNGLIFRGSTPKQFKKYLYRHMVLSREENKDYIFINAWNEWGEGCHLEPDTDYGYGYLEAVKSALERL